MARRTLEAFAIHALSATPRSPSARSPGMASFLRIEVACPRRHGSVVQSCISKLEAIGGHGGFYTCVTTCIHVKIHTTRKPTPTKFRWVPDYLSPLRTVQRLR